MKTAAVNNIVSVREREQAVGERKEESYSCASSATQPIFFSLPLRRARNTAEFAFLLCFVFSFPQQVLTLTIYYFLLSWIE